MHLQCWISGLCCLLVANSSFGQEPPGVVAQREAMKKLNGWVGTWKGSGWAQRGPTEKHEFQVTETVQPKIGGLVLLVEGLGTRLDPSSNKETIGHNAMAMVSYDEKGKRYRFRSQSMQGRSGDDELKVIDGGFEWGFKEETAGITLRFTIRLDDKTWVESGEMSRDGKNWNKFMEMKLTKQAATK